MTDTRTILVVDDEAHIRHLLELKLRERGFHVVLASNGKDGFQLASEHLPVAIITDYQRPGCDGMDVCQQLARQPETASIPVLMLTARGHRIDDEALAKTNIRGLLDKPFSPRKLITLVDEMLDPDAGGAAAA